MIVYGDPQYSIPRAEARERLRAFFHHTASDETDPARDLLIALGQIEQAVADAADSHDPALFAIMQATDRAAEFFVSKILGKPPTAALLHASQNSTAIALAGDEDLKIKIPEGFAFYSLFPEQYLAATESWVGQTPRLSSPGAPARTDFRGVLPTTPILVVGIRSIGTTLSAVVRAALLAFGFPAERITVRPHGHPFHRVTELPATVSSTSAAIIVDEGPGLSGSSFASVAQALWQSGVTEITFFPSHKTPPGAAASRDTKKIWSQVPSITCPIFDAPPHSNPLIQSLRQRTEELLSSHIRELHNLSAGQWQSHIQSTAPFHIAPQLERTKFRFTAENGRSILWKFAGLGSGPRLENLTTAAVARQNDLARKSWTLPALAHIHGFIATEWIDAPRLSSTHFASHHCALARYLAESSLPPLTKTECRSSIDRLAEMLQCNLTEAGLNVTCIHNLRPNTARLSRLPASGDGRLAPHEWLLHDRHLFKTDSWGHHTDHTIIGRQPILWDIAGAIIEWNITGVPSFLRTLHEHKIHIHPEDLPFFLLAYTAFQIGLHTFAANPQAIAHYRTKAETLP